jgi:hypothetical protein
MPARDNEGAARAFGEQGTGGNATGQSIGRYNTNKTFRFPHHGAYGNDDFNTPMVHFVILDAFGNRINNAPKVQLKSPTQLNLSNINNYSQDGPIFGVGAFGANAAAAGADAAAAAKESGGQFDAAAFGFSAAEALEYSIKKSGTGLASFISTAGMGNASQWEFSQRRAINPMTQQLFKGPNYRRYSLPFNMRPRNKNDAKSIRSAVQTMRLASSSAVPQTNATSLTDGLDFTFGYPHLLQFAVKTAGRNIFVSKPCVIESLSVDYGTQKMTFFDDNFPTETNMALSLIEISPRTLGDAIGDQVDTNRTLA